MRVDFNQVVEAYNGPHGCRCGCKGHSHDVKNDKTGAIRIVNRMNKLIKANAAEFEENENMAVVKTISRTYIAFYKKAPVDHCNRYLAKYGSHGVAL